MNLPPIQNSLRRRARQAGLTLIELLIVLLILVAVAGIVVPLFPDMQRRAHASTNAANITETHKAIQLYAATSLSQPDGWDSLISEGDVTFRNDRFTRVPDLSVTGLPLRIRAALNAAGIRTSHQLVDGIQRNGRPNDDEGGTFGRPAGTPRINTFSNYYSATTYDLADNGAVVVLGGTVDLTTGVPGGGLNEITRLNLPAPGPDAPYEAYVAFGIGNRLSALDSTMLEPPVHFPDGGDRDPSQAYGRLVAIYGIPTNGGPARHLRTAAVHNDHFDSLGDTLEDFYETVSN